MAQIVEPENIQALPSIYNAVDVGDDSLDDWKLENQFVTEDGDPSWLMRITYWIYAIKVFDDSLPTSLFLGVGPGVFGGAIDGSYVRLVTESGIFGLVAFLYLLHIIARTNKGLRYCVGCVMLNMIFIDVYLSYKSMTLLFLLFGRYWIRGTQTDSRRLLGNRNA